MPHMTPDALRQAEREARDEAAPFAVLAALALIALALTSMHADWRLFGGAAWWVWLVAAASFAILSLTLVAGLGRDRRSEHRRTLMTIVLGVVVAVNLVEIGLLVTSLVVGSTLSISGPQLLHSATTLWFSNVIAFGLAFWELDCGGPVRRALADARHGPDFQFPQDENPQLARPGWAPHLLDYVYISVTNSVAFSPTDAMPLSRSAKVLMAIESAVSVIALVLITARAVNILQM